MTRLSGLLSQLFLLVTLLPSAQARPYRHVQTLTASNAEPGDLFGTLVDLDGDIAIVRSRTRLIIDDRPQDPTPQTHVFGFNGSSFVESGVIVASSRVSNSHALLGREVALDNGTIVIGMVGRNTSYQDIEFSDVTSTTLPTSWEAIRYPRDIDEWLQVREKVQSYIKVGHDVAISGDFALMNDRSGSTPDGQQGVVHTYQSTASNEWTYAGFLKPNETLSDTVFGNYLSADQGTAMITEYLPVNWQRLPETPSAIYFFDQGDNNEWEQSARLDLRAEEQPVWWKAPTPWEEVHGGAAFRVELEGNLALASYNVRNEKGYQNMTLVLARQGVADPQNPSGWEVVQALDGPLGNSHKYYDIDQDRFAITVRDTDESRTQRVDLYEHNADSGQWERYESIYSPHPAYANTFGTSLAFDKGKLLVSAIGGESVYSRENNQIGAAFLFVLVPEPSATVLLAVGLTLFLAIKIKSRRTVISDAFSTQLR